MKFEGPESIVYSDTPVPDIFLSEYMPSMESEYVKLYLHCLFLAGRKKRSSHEDMSKKLNMEIDSVREGLVYLEGLGLLKRKEDKIEVTDLKQREVNKIYRMKSTSTPEEAALSGERNKKRNMIITAINDSFFQGVMSPSWYTDIDSWFDKFGFEEDVMLSLFRHCFDHKTLNKNYIIKVAESWCSRGIKNSFDLDNYFNDYKKCKDTGRFVARKLKLNRNLTQYEEDYIEKWVMEYKYDEKIIDTALKKTTGKTNPSFKYIDAVINNWKNSGLSSKDEILAFEKKRSDQTKSKSQSKTDAPQKKNFEQRKYDDEFLKNLDQGREQ